MDSLGKNAKREVRNFPTPPFSETVQRRYFLPNLLKILVEAAGIEPPPRNCACVVGEYATLRKQNS